MRLSSFQIGKCRFIFTPRKRRSTQFGLFHNLGEPHEETGYISLHLFGARFSLYWSREVLR